MTEIPFGRFLLPGPTEVHPDVLAAMLRPMIAHRGSEMVQLIEGLEQPLQRMFRTERRVLIGSCAATGFMEMAVRCGIRHRVLALVSGSFGARFAGIAEACGHDVVRLEVPLGETVEPDMLHDALRRSDVDAVSLVHSETSTGALAPLPELAAVVHERDDVLLLVDAVTSLAGSPVETDALNLDFVFTGSQKALALPPGLALGVASERLLARAKTLPGRGAYLDVLAYDDAFAERQPTNTPALSLFFALAEQSRRIEREGGIGAWWTRHDAMRRTVEDWVAGPGGALGYRYLPREGRRSWTVSCLRVPEGRNGRDIVRAVRKAGWILGTGYGPLRESTLRIGHMGDHSVDTVRVALERIEEATG
ncbi:MAG: aminotransferase class V-fold PLP-dependent enzyme [Gemmatimonadota bacterium]|nr:aminotransferase class V-fold PLP-dependent enzyme [Gemmatimonadota bacterium]MDH5195984.1 aminotransferase class V-fold PLP-dependent enzyme [Gemmatimonadota bacterium]